MEQQSGGGLLTPLPFGTTILVLRRFTAWRLGELTRPGTQRCSVLRSGCICSVERSISGGTIPTGRSWLAEVSLYVHKHAVGVANEVISNAVTDQA